jgi:hypothetical protein
MVMAVRFGSFFVCVVIFDAEFVFAAAAENKVLACCEGRKHFTSINTAIGEWI